LTAARPAAGLEGAGVEVAWREGTIAEPRGAVGLAADSERMAVAAGGEVAVGPRSLDELREAEIVTHDAKALRVDARDDTLLAAYLIDPGRASYDLDDLAAEYGVEVLPTPEAEPETAALVRSAEAARRLSGPLCERL